MKAFMGLMGEHFSAMADKEEAEKAKAAARAAAEPQPLIAPARTKEEIKAEEVAKRAMSDPEVVAVLQEHEIQTLLQNMQLGKQFELEKAMQKPEMVAKLKKLSA